MVGKSCVKEGRGKVIVYQYVMPNVRKLLVELNSTLPFFSQFYVIQYVDWDSSYNEIVSREKIRPCNNKYAMSYYFKLEKRRKILIGGIRTE